MKKIKKYIPLLLLLILIISNALWLKLYTHEHEKLKHALIPSPESDYFTTQKIITNYQVQSENRKENIWRPIYEMSADNTSFYNTYFRTEEEYTLFRKEHTNQKEVPLLLQNPDYPNGCEAASMVMVLQHLGIHISLKDFIENYLEKENVYEKAGERFGPDPAISYAGDPASVNRGWGTFEPVILKATLKIIENNSLKEKISILNGEKEKTPLYFLASEEMPSVIWVTTDYHEVESVYEWFSFDKQSIYTYPKNAHAVVLTGMDTDYYYINDPLKEEKNKKVPKEQLEKSFDSMGRQFITFKKVQ